MIAIHGARLGPEGPQISIVASGKRIRSVLLPDQAGATQPRHAIDAGGLIVMPGIIDPHVHFRVPGNSEKEDWETGSAAAVKGGVTTVADMPNTDPPTTTIARLVEKRMLAKKGVVNARFWFGATPDNTSEVVQAHEEPDVLGVKVYLAQTTGSLLFDDKKALRKLFGACARIGMVVAVHAEDDATIRANCEQIRRAGREPNIWDHAVIHSADSSAKAVGDVLELQRATGCRVYFCHLSAPRDIERVYEAKTRTKRQKIFSEVCVRHLTACRIENLPDTPEYRFSEAFHKVNPPLLARRDILRLRELALGGYADTLASDHAPHLLDEKRRDAYAQIPSGMPEIEWCAALTFPYVTQQELSYDHYCALTSGNAARIFGKKIGKKGKIAPGYHADLVLVDDRGLWHIDPDDVRTKSGMNPYAGHPTTARVVLTMVRGKVAYDPDNLTGGRR